MVGKPKQQAGFVSNYLRAPAQLKQTVLIPTCITMVLALSLGFIGHTAAISALAGGMIVVVANAYSTWRVFARADEEPAAQALSTLYRAEVGKLLMMGALFTAVFAGWKNVNVIAFLAGCAVAMFTAPIAVAFSNANEHIVPKRETGTETDG
ncbi:ATP synthase subunit I [Pseudomonadota bacterium]